VAIIEATNEEIKKCAPVFNADRTLIELYGRFWESFDDKRGFAWEADTLITSVGSTGSGPIPEHSSLIHHGKIEDPLLEEKVVGNIVSILFDRTAKEITVARGKIKQHVVRPTMELIKDIARRHTGWKNTGAGVVVIASSVKKADTIRTLLQNGFINELIVDSGTAEEILRNM
jgi:DNA-binding transcriptional regulator LsrR (DeoR family)